MPETWTLGVEDFLRGDRGKLDPHVTNLMQIENMRLNDDGLLMNRPHWEASYYNFPGVEWNVQLTKFVRTGFYQQKHVEVRGVMALARGSTEANMPDPPILFVQDDGDDAEIFQHPTYKLTNNAPRPTSWVSPVSGERLLVDNWIVEMTSPWTGADWENPVETFGWIKTTKLQTSLPQPGISGDNIANAWGNQVNTYYHLGRAYFWYKLTEGNVNVDDGAGGTPLGMIAAPQYRLYYTEPNDISAAIPAQNLIEYDSQIQALIGIGPHLYVCLDDGQWWEIISRGDPVQGTQTLLGHFSPPHLHIHPVKVGADVWYITNDGRRLAHLRDRMIDVESHNHIELAPSPVLHNQYPTNWGLTASKYFPVVVAPRILVPGQFFRLDRMWTQDNTSLSCSATHFLIDDKDQKEYLVRKDPGNNLTYLHRRDMFKNEPSSSVAGNFSEYAEDPSAAGAHNGKLTLPLLQSPGHLVRPTRVEVQGLAWKGTTGGRTFPTPNLSISATNAAGAETFGLSPGATVWDTVPVGAGKPFRVAGSALPPFSLEYTITIDDIRSLGIGTITVEYETTEMDSAVTSQ